MGAPRRFGDGVVQIAEPVDQAELMGGAAVPDPALGYFVDPRGRKWRAVATKATKRR